MRAYGYQALARVGPNQSAGDLIHALQGDLAQQGFLLTQYKTRQIKGQPGPIGLALVCVPQSGSLFAVSDVKNMIDRMIVVETGKAPIWSRDPAPCGGCCVTADTLALVSNQGKGLTCCGKRVGSLPLVSSGWIDTTLGSLGATGTAIQNALPSWQSVAVWGFLAVAALIFVYAYGKSR
jgi:hypothetical protein